MKCRGWPLLAAVLLTACGGASDATGGQPVGAADEATPLPEVHGPQQRILAFGDSLFAGYGLKGGESYPVRLEQALREQGRNVRVTNAGVSGDTSAAGLQRLEYVLDSTDALPDLAIVELGGNDLLRGISPAETRRNLGAMLDMLEERRIPVLLMGMRAPPNLGEAYVREFDAIYPALAEEHGAALVPFFLESVYDQPAMIQVDRVHPTAKGIEAIVAATVGEVAAALPEAR